MDNTKIFKGYENIFAERLRLLMKQHSTKQTELAEYLGLTRQAISKYADGSVLPNIENLERICKYFNVSSDFLIGLTNSDSLNNDERYCSDITGLNANSIKVLNSISRKETEEEKIILKLMDNILVHKESLIVLATKIIECYKAYTEKQLQTNPSLAFQKVESAQFDYSTSKFLACDWFNEPIEDVAISLYKEREETHAKKDK